MLSVIGLRFRKVGDIRYFIQKKNKLEVGNFVVAETKRGQEFGEVVVIKNSGDFELLKKSTEKILRKANKEDIDTHYENIEKEKRAYDICVKKIKEHKLDMKLIEVEYMFDSSKIIFYFVSDSRVDFRELVKHLAYIFKVRIELKQVGVRDEARILGGLGICGKPLCCATFLDDFQPVSIKMAKDQGLSLNPTKISGTCGRLMCCLKYEEDTYLDALGSMPKIGSSVETPQGFGTVINQNVLSKKVKVILDDKSESVPLTYDIGDIKQL